MNNIFNLLLPSVLMELTSFAYRFVKVTGIIGLIISFSLGLSMIVMGLNHDSDPAAGSAGVLLGFIMLTAGAVLLALHWLLVVGVKDGAIRIRLPPESA